MWKYLKPLLQHTDWPDWPHVARVWPDERELVTQYRSLTLRVRVAARSRDEWFAPVALRVTPCAFPALACATVAAIVLRFPVARKHLADYWVDPVKGLRREIEVRVLSFAFEPLGYEFKVAPGSVAILGHGRGFRKRRYGRKAKWQLSGGAPGYLRVSGDRVCGWWWGGDCR